MSTLSTLSTWLMFSRPLTLRVRLWYEGNVGEKTKEKNPAAVALGKLGGAKGGPARARALSSIKRRQIARKAARKRWQKAG